MTIMCVRYKAWAIKESRSNTSHGRAFHFSSFLPCLSPWSTHLTTHNTSSLPIWVSPNCLSCVSLWQEKDTHTEGRRWRECEWSHSLCSVCSLCEAIHYKSTQLSYVGKEERLDLCFFSHMIIHSLMTQGLTDWGRDFYGCCCGSSLSRSDFERLVLCILQLFVALVWQKSVRFFSTFSPLLLLFCVIVCSLVEE